ncbi:MAG: phosphoribosylglycinamide formyltransferase [Chromatiales bacterium]|nr:phosphoribosylglycinamide formyltransferase [Chromatiales bacterium]
MTAGKLPIVVLISGGGSNLQAIIDAASNDMPVAIRAVISNRADAYGLERAREANIETVVVDHTQFDSRQAFDTELARVIDRFGPGLVVLAGFMRILSDDFVHHYEGRMLNIHPSLLPKYKGTNTHARAIDAGDSEAGCSVHLVTTELDSGPVLHQARVPILPDDTPELLAARVLEQEHLIYPEAIRQFAITRLK